MKTKSLPHIQTGLIIFIIIFGLLMGASFPKEVAWMPDGFKSPIIAFEFLETNDEIENFFGSNIDFRNQIAEGLNSGNRYDDIYLIFYSLFIYSWLWLTIGIKSKFGYVLIISSCACLALTDFFENRQMIAIASTLESGDFTVELYRLHILTWFKWGLLSVLLFIISYHLRDLNSIRFIVITISSLTLIFGFVAFLERSVVTTYFTQGVIYQFYILFILTFRNLYRFYFPKKI